MAKKGGIGKSLLVSYFILLLAFIIVTGFTFNILSNRYLINEAKKQMLEEGKAIANKLEGWTLTEIGIRDRLMARRELRLATSNLEAKIIVINSERKVLFANIQAGDLSKYQNIINGGRRDRDYVISRVPINSDTGKAVGQVILVTKTQDIKALNWLIGRVQLFSLLIAGIIAIIMAFAFENKITSPIKKLTGYMQGFNIIKSKALEIKTGDEIEELAETFNELTNKLREYDEKQMRFLQNTSHELKTPLMSIQGYAEAIKEGIVEGDEITKSLDIIIEESKRLKKTVDEVIYLTRLESTENSSNRKAIDLGDLVHQSVEKVRAIAKEGNISIYISGQYPVANINGDEILRAIVNILGNSLRFANSRIDIEGSLQKGFVEITLRDDGPGFKEGEEKIVFERFYKGEKGGTGIGLAIVKAIIEGHGGSAKAKNVLPHGACFIIQLPIRNDK
ncbi:sensor histidine kinase [Alkaliphilus serpentinus]|uniref:histidine kinase n=1 Tax=Alkaliphilus serpentinus TaxID=1482731 RepID=A0A833HPN6_9FIRM|nr:HAMP domain-containing sensor histidine kinase [Alkaliphilus serpentinus]KAB3531067.1 HAMP domain-containing histidine kinase [Alkaliphilus serpentinus]